MNESNNSIGSCYSDAMYSTSWPKTKPINVAEQLEKWNKVRQSLYSQNGWCSENVNQISKWDVGDLDINGLVPTINMQGNMHKDGHETGTNIWNMNVNQISKWNVGDLNINGLDLKDGYETGTNIWNTKVTMHQDGYEAGTNNWNMNLSHQHGNKPYPPVQNPFLRATETSAGTAAATATATFAINTPSQQMTHWENTGAIPKMYNNNNPTNLNCLSVNAPNFEFPTSGSSSQQIASPPEKQNATVFDDCDKMKSQPTNNPDDDVNLALRLQFETMNLEKNPISRSICNQMSNQYQVDCFPQAFS